MSHVKLSSIIFSEMIELPSILPPLAPPDRPLVDQDDYPFDFQRRDVVSVRDDVTDAEAAASLAEDTERIVMGVTDTSTSFTEHRALSKIAVAYVRTIIENSEGTLRSGSKNINTKRKGAFRIQPVDAKNPPAPDMVLSFIRSAGLRVVRVIPPGAEDASSSKFNTYVLRGKPTTGRPVQFKFVYGQGRNAGHTYEDDIRDQLQRLVESKGTVSSKFINELAAKIGSFTPKDIVDYRYTANGQLIRRPLSDKPMNVGALVADFVLAARRQNGAGFAQGPTWYDGRKWRLRWLVPRARAGQRPCEVCAEGTSTGQVSCRWMRSEQVQDGHRNCELRQPDAYCGASH